MGIKESARAFAAGSQSERLDEDARDGRSEQEHQREPLLELLAKEGVASREDLGIALAEGLRNGKRLGELVLLRGWLDEAGLARLVARQWDIDFLDEDALELDRRAAALLPARAARDLQACAIGFQGEIAVVVVAEPAESRFAAVRAAFAGKVVFAVVTRGALDRLLDELPAVEEQEYELDATEAVTGLSGDRDNETESLLVELDRAMASLASFRDRLEPLVTMQERTADELAECRERLASFEGERASDLEARRRLEDELGQQRELFAAVKEKLLDVGRTLEVRE